MIRVFVTLINYNVPNWNVTLLDVLTLLFVSGAHHKLSDNLLILISHSNNSKCRLLSLSVCRVCVHTSMFGMFSWNVDVYYSRDNGKRPSNDCVELPFDLYISYREAKTPGGTLNINYWEAVKNVLKMNSPGHKSGNGCGSAGILQTGPGKHRSSWEFTETYNPKLCLTSYGVMKVHVSLMFHFRSRWRKLIFSLQVSQDSM